jgi:hypothetical protein
MVDEVLAHALTAKPVPVEWNEAEEPLPATPAADLEPGTIITH